MVTTFSVPEPLLSSAVGTVVSELVTPWIVRHIRAHPALAAGVVLLAVALLMRHH